MEETTRSLDPGLIRKAYSYEEYLEMTEVLVLEGRTTGPDQSEKFIDFTRLNLHRIKRIFKTMKLDLDTVMMMEKEQEPMLWLVIAEAWCGDVAQNIPYIQAFADLNPHIELKLVLKNEHPELMQQFLTGGAESIPKLICLDSRSFQIIGTWGPRPAGAQKILADFKKNPDRPKAEMLEDIQRWYLKDKGQSIQKEFRQKMEDWRMELARDMTTK